MSPLHSLDWLAVRRQYRIQEKVHHRLLRLHANGKVKEFADLALGISDPAGNYSAAEHIIGPRVLAENADAVRRVFGLASQFMTLSAARQVPPLIRQAALRHLQIRVGSEVSCLVNPQICWVANTRTIWTHLVIKHADDFDKANEELALYRAADVSSEMEYSMWAAIHAELAGTMTRIAKEGQRLASGASVATGTVMYLWADAIANQLYEDYHE